MVYLINNLKYQIQFHHLLQCLSQYQLFLIVIGLMKDELARKVMRKFVRLRSKTYSYLIDEVKTKKQKSQKLCHRNKT